MMWVDGGGWVWMTLMMLGFWALLIFGGVALYRATRQPGGTQQNEALHLLDARFARGEIDDEDYSRRRALLRSGN